MGDGGSRQRKAFEQPDVTLPREPTLAAAIKCAVPDSGCLLRKSVKPIPIARQTEVSEVSAQNAAQPSILQHNRRVHSPPRLGTKFFELAGEPLAVGAALDHETPVPARRTIMRKAQEPKRLAAMCAALPAQLT